MILMILQDKTVEDEASFFLFCCQKLWVTALIALFRGFHNARFSIILFLTILTLLHVSIIKYSKTALVLTATCMFMNKKKTLQDLGFRAFAWIVLILMECNQAWLWKKKKHNVTFFLNVWELHYLHSAKKKKVYICALGR